MTRIVLTGCTAAVLLAGCGGSGDDGREVPFEIVESSSVSGIQSPTFVAIETPAAWAELWARHASVRLPPPPMPEVDFTRYRVLVVMAGSRANACWGLTISAVREFPNEQVLHYRATDPGGAPCATVITTPAQMVRAAASKLPVRFVAD